MRTNRLSCVAAMLITCLVDSSSARATDCNGNGYPDDVEIHPILFTHVSPSLTIAPIVGQTDYQIDNPPQAISNVTFSLAGKGIATGNVTVSLSVSTVGTTSWVGGGAGCSNRTAAFTIPAAQFNAAKVNGKVLVKVFSTGNLTCQTNATVVVTINYTPPQISQDCNNDGLPDQCNLIPDVNPLPPGNCAQAQAVCPNYTYAHSNENGSLNTSTTTPCVGWWTSGNVFYKYTPSDSGALKIAADYNVNAPNGLEPILWVFSGCPTSFITNMLACNKWSPGNPLHAEINMQVTGGHTYYIQVGEYQDTQERDYLLRLTGPPCLLTTAGTGGPYDCNHNGKLDSCDIATHTSNDCDANGVPDECEPDCNANAVADGCDIASGTSHDCNANNIPDECDIAHGTSKDCNHNNRPDECDIATATSQDCNSNQIPDECDMATGALTDCNNNGTADACEQSSCRYPSEMSSNTSGYPSSNFVGPPDNLGGILYNRTITFHYICGQIVNGPGPDFNVYRANSYPTYFGHLTTLAVSADGATWYEVQSTMGPGMHIPGDIGLLNEDSFRSFALPDNLQHASYVRTGYTGNVVNYGLEVDAIGAIHALFSGDCNGNGIPDNCDMTSGTLHDANLDSVMDECVLDCNNNGLPDIFELTEHVSPDCNNNGIPDACDIAASVSADCNSNGAPDSCEMATGSGKDCDGNGMLDSCDLARGLAKDCNQNGVPDGCEIAAHTVTDCDGNGVPDTCQADCNHNSVPDVCEGLSVTVDAGPDHSICPGESITLGGSPTATGGAPPLTYRWLVNGAPIDVPVLDQQQTVTNMSIFSGGASQTFVAGRAGELRGIDVLLGTNASQGTLSINTGAYGSLITSRPVTLGNGWNQFDLSCPVALVAGQTYEWSLFCGQGIDIPLSNNNPYPAGVSQGANGQWDFAFKTYVGNPTGLCTPTDANPVAQPIQTTSYRVEVANSAGCTSSADEAVITVRQDHPCLKLNALTLGGDRPYIIGQSVPLGVQLSANAPAGGTTIDVKAQGFPDQIIQIPAGSDAATRDVTIQSLGETLQSLAEIQGLGGVIRSSNYSVLPKVDGVSLGGTPPYRTGALVPITVTLREPAIAGGATVHLTCDAFNAFDISIAAGSNTGTGQAELRLAGDAFIVTATGQTRSARSVASDPFQVFAAGDLYVNALIGSDDNPGLTPAQPVQTLGHALQLATHGYKIHVARGIYAEHVVVDKNVEILGAGADLTFVDATWTDRPIRIDNYVVTTISGMTLMNGLPTDTSSSRAGGGIYIGYYCAVTLRDCELRNNSSPRFGGGIYSENTGQLSLFNCTVSGNDAAGYGGGIYGNTVNLFMTNCTISGNSCTGAFSTLGGGVFNAGSSKLNHCTITNNTAALGGGLFGSGSVMLSDCIVAGNHASEGGTDVQTFSGAVQSGGYNLIGSPTGSVFGTLTDLIGVEPMLGPLGMHGGSTATHALGAGSPAVDAGNPATCTDALGQPLVSDQRGRLRPFDGDADGAVRCDIGAFERNSPVADLDGDEDVDLDDVVIFGLCTSGPALSDGTSPACRAADFDHDRDVDQSDFGVLQRCYSGAGRPADANCAR